MGKRAILEALLNTMNLGHLLKGFTSAAPANARAIARIRKGESPYHVLTDENNIPTDTKSRSIRAMKEGYGSLSDIEIHGSKSDITGFNKGTHFGTVKAADEASSGKGSMEFFNAEELKEEIKKEGIEKIRDSYPTLGQLLENPDSYGDDLTYQTRYPVVLRNKNESAQTFDIDQTGDGSDIYEYMDASNNPGKYGFGSGAREITDDGKLKDFKNTKDFDTLNYENLMEDSGSTSYINAKENVRSPHSQFNPNWSKFKDLLASGAPLAMLIPQIKELLNQSPLSQLGEKPDG